jgi:hypothetical protein
VKSQRVPKVLLAAVLLVSMAMALGSSASTPVRAQGLVQYSLLTWGNGLPLCLTVPPELLGAKPPPAGAIPQKTTGQLRVPVAEIWRAAYGEIDLSEVTCNSNEVPIIAVLYFSTEWDGPMGEPGGGFPWNEAPWDWSPYPYLYP